MTFRRLLPGLLLSCLASSVIFLIVNKLGLFSSWEEASHRQLEIHTPAVPHPLPPLLFINLKEMGSEGWPLPHLDYAILLHSIAPHGPDVLALNLPLAESDTFYAVYEKQLARQMTKFRSVIVSVPVKSSPPAGAQGSTQSFPSLPHKGDLQHLPPMHSEKGLVAEYQHNTQAAPAAAPAGKSGTLRRLPLVFHMDGKAVPGFVLQIYAKQIGAFLPNCEVILGQKILLRDYKNTLLQEIPVDEEGRLFLRFPLQPQPLGEGEFYSVILSAEQIRNGRPPDVDLNRLRHAIAFVGVEAPEASVPLPTPEGPLSLSRLYARALAQIFAGDFVREPSTAVLFLILFGTGTAMAFLGLLPTRLSLIGLATGLVLIIGDVVVIYQWIHWKLPFIALAFNSLACWAAGFGLREIFAPPPRPPLLLLMPPGHSDIPVQKELF